MEKIEGASEKASSSSSRQKKKEIIVITERTISSFIFIAKLSSIEECN